jgi:hypothetical protein
MQICTSVVAEALAGQDLTPLEYALLANLNDDPDVDQIGIAGRLGIDRNSAGNLIRRLEQREPCAAANERGRPPRAPGASHVEGTSCASARPLIVAHQQRILSVLPAVDRERFLDQLVLVIKANEAYARPGAGRRRRETAARHTNSREECHAHQAALESCPRRRAPALACRVARVIARRPWPQRTVRIILPLPAGTATDTAARLFAQGLSARWGQPVIVENRPGGDGIPAVTGFVAR